MTLMRFERTAIPGGFILADAEVAAAADWFDAEHWRGQGQGSALGRGRGLALSAGPGGCWVLRHYRRGGMPGRWSEDCYLWTGAERTRPVRELRVLARLREAGAPVPRPVAARVLRRGLFYRGDLLTERVAGAVTLAQAAPTLPPEGWRTVGRALRRFHAAGGGHADLNAHNVLVAPAGVVIVDLDRGRIVRPGSPAQRRSVARLERSLTKLGHLPARRAGWDVLLAGYREPR